MSSEDSFHSESERKLSSCKNYVIVCLNYTYMWKNDLFLAKQSITLLRKKCIELRAYAFQLALEEDNFAEILETRYLKWE